MDVDARSAEVISVIESALADEVEAGRVRLEVGFWGGRWGVDVEPTNGRACPVSVLAEAPQQINLYIGQHRARATLELFKKGDRGNLLTELRQLLRALAEGRYRQTVKVKRLSTGRIRIRGEFRLPEGPPYVHRYWGNGSGPFDQRETYTVEYEPY